VGDLIRGWSRGARPGQGRVVELRRERNGDNKRFLDAWVTPEGSLVLSGHDLGPATEYEWSHTFPTESIPALRAALGGEEHEDILDVLERYRGDRSYDLSRVLHETDDAIPREFWSWRS
jgi:hypothetical protein